MLRYKIEHFYGSQEKHDMQLVRLMLDSENLDENEALENGWLFCKEWYQCRSVRLRVSDYKAKLSTHSTMYADVLDHDDDLMPLLNGIRKQYLDYKGFEEEYDIYTDLDRAKWLILADGPSAVAFTKLNMYEGGMESQFTCWNYHEPKMRVGKMIVDYEVQVAKHYGFDYLYIGQGCERGSKYKADFGGFEWWTGSEWSTDRDEYKALCDRDSDINTLSDLAKAMNA